jgi:hypothetical protein
LEAIADEDCSPAWSSRENPVVSARTRTNAVAREDGIR